MLQPLASAYVSVLVSFIMLQSATVSSEHALMFTLFSWPCHVGYRSL
jgi:hypothetical protein